MSEETVEDILLDINEVALNVSAQEILSVFNNQQSTINNQHSTINNQQSHLSNVFASLLY